MRVGFSAYFLDKPTTGSGQYARSLVKALLALGGVELTLFCPTRASLRAARRLLGEAGDPPGSEAVLVGSPGRGDLGKLWFEQVGIVWACRGRRLDLLHIPYFGPPLVNRLPTVVTVHDLIMRVVPQHRGSALVRAYGSLAAAATKRARLVIAVSECSRRDIISELGLGPDRIRVVYEAAEERFHPMSEEERRAVVAKYGLEDGFVLYLGGLDWRKNVDGLIRAFARLPGKGQLAIAGAARSTNRAHFPDLAAVVRALRAEDRVRFLGWVDEEDKPALYSAARLFVFPSRYEGFGLPPLEAMACGTPVLCSNAASLPEVVGEAARLFDPEDETGLREALAELWADEEQRKALSRRGLERARRFSWKRTAQDTLAAYGAALEGW